jgi:hypothetical protein
MQSSLGWVTQVSTANIVEVVEIEIHIAAPLPAMPKAKDATTFNVVLEDTLPDLFGPDANHKCVYRDLAMTYLQKDLQHRSTQRVAGKCR